MILDTVKTETVFEVEVKNLNQNRVEVGLGFLRYDDNYSIFVNKKLYKIEIIDISKLDEIDFFFKTRNYTAVVNVIESIRDKFFTMEIIFFAYPIRTIYTPFYISLDEKILETARKQKTIKNHEDIQKLAEVMKNKVSFKINDETYFLVSSGGSSKDEIFHTDFSNIAKDIEKIEKSLNISDNDKKEKIEKLELEFKKLYKEEKDLAFSLHGDFIHLPVRKEITQSGDFRFTATKLVSFKKSIKKDSLQLIKADIEFTNGLVSAKIAKDLGNIVESDESYLKKWDEYSRLEGDMLLDKAKNIGELTLATKPNKTKDGYSLKLETLPDELNEEDTIAFVDEIPNYIKDNLSWIEYLAELEQSEKSQLKKKKIETFLISKIEHGFITIETEKDISNIKDKKIILSILGDEIQIKRKLEARKRLLDGKSANPFLGLIIEDTDNIKNYQKTQKLKRIEPLSEQINKKIFSTNPPTPNQIEAIDIALNTPDIAIIQGPPGTGKTTIVTAIIERLNELSDKSEKSKGEIFVTGVQHDAVENIISRLNINGLPTPKFGKKSTTIADINSFDNIMSWSSEISRKVKSNLPELSNHEKIAKLEKYFDIYIKIPSEKFAVELLKYIVYDLSSLGDETVKEAEELLKRLKISKVDEIKNLKNIYALRTTIAGFKDDGKERNQDLLLSELGQSFDISEKKILQDIDKDLDGYLKKLTKLKFNLIDRLYPKATYRDEKPNEEIIQLIDKVKNELSKGSTTKDKIGMVLANYVNELENNPFALKSLIEKYSFVFSATTGQSSHASREKQERRDEYVSFDTVIIDEAARVSPMDLLIVMVLAKRRIILVGDHRQLPHIVDENVIKDSELSEDDFITKSMFGYLKDRAKTLESYDGIKRAITLENQYRTHPLLGEFISENFYEKHKESFNSPLQNTKKYFYQNLKEIENIPAIWLDVKNVECKEERAWSRGCESKKIVEYLRRWILSDEGKELSFGIITFYRKQVESIKSELKNEFSKEERDLFKKRLKVGTVDSFQGMEFDIVFLSIVRSKDIKTISDKLKDYNLFGFLISKNRLCVSMSRQKKSLIVVGDKAFFDSDRAKRDVEELHNFLQLCKSEGKVI